MTIAFESGYVLPGGDLSLNNARMLHRGNRLLSRSVVGSSEVSGYEAEAADTALTEDVWKPFANDIESPADFSTSDWTLGAVTVSDDGRTLTEDATTGNHKITYANTPALEAVEYVTSVRVKLTGGRYQIAISIDDGTTSATETYNLYDLTTSGTLDGSVIRAGVDEYICQVKYTPAAGTLGLDIFMLNDSASDSYAGDLSQSIEIINVSHHKSEATWDFAGYGASACDVFCIAAHNIGEAGGTLTFSHDSNDDATFTDIGAVTPDDNSPIMFIHEGVTSTKWRVTVSGATLPCLGVIRIGKLLQWQRPFYGGFAPSIGRRNTVMRGNKSVGGKWLGRTKVATSQSANYSWEHLTQAWVRENLLGLDGVLRAIEDEPFFMAWRAGAESDVDYAMTSGSQDGWENMGVVNLTSFAISAEVHGHD